MMRLAIPRAGLAARLALVLVVQLGALGWMIADRALLLRGGAEVRLAVAPVDPRDLLRGDYVELAYDISTIGADRVDDGDDLGVGDSVWVTLETRPDRPATLAGVSAVAPSREDGRVTLKGRIWATSRSADTPGCVAPCRTLRVRYGIERFFVPEGEGRVLETLRDDQRVEIVAVADERGHSTIKSLMVDGEVRYQEPLL